LTFNKLKLTLATIATFALVTTWSYFWDDNTALEAAQRASSERYLKSEMGNTRYQVFGDENRPTIVLIHSFNGYLESWTPNIDSLVKAGYRVVAYDLWGRGLTSRPRVNLSLPVFRAQLGALLNEIGAKRVILMGSSFGCVVASDYALSYPDQVETLLLIGPAGWPSSQDSQFIHVPLVADLAFHFFGKQLLRPIVEAYFYKEPTGWALDAWDKYATYPGFTRSALSTLRYAPVTDYTDGWRKLGSLGKPTLFVWGKHDVSFPYTNTEKVAVLIPHAKVVGIEGAAHWVNIEKAAAVNAAVVEFLRQ
jgi:pimeloyl-ACP methyl ester carboxylesterase